MRGLFSSSLKFFLAVTCHHTKKSLFPKFDNARGDTPTTERSTARRSLHRQVTSEKDTTTPVGSEAMSPGRQAQVVLLEDRHENVNAWHERPAPPPPDITKQGGAFAMSLTFVVSTALVLVALVVAYGPAAAKAIKLYLKGGSASVRPKGSKKATQSKKDEKAAAKSEKQSLAKKKSNGLRSVPAHEDEEDEEELQDDDDDEEEEDEEEDEEDEEEDLRTKYPLGSEALAINLKDKKHIQHNKKVGVVKKVDAAAGKIYLQMKSSGARLVLKSDNVQPVSHAAKTKGKRKG